jgi:hypothetical protein
MFGFGGGWFWDGYFEHSVHYGFGETDQKVHKTANLVEDINTYPLH